MDNKSPSQEDIREKREFAYRAYSPDSEPPSPQQDEKSQKNKADQLGDSAQTEGKPTQRENGRQSA